jgi:hypothetical protein
VRENRTPGSVRGLLGDWQSYRDCAIFTAVQFRQSVFKSSELPMATEAQPEWTRFRVGSPSTDTNWVNPDCQRLSTVYHVVHLDIALRITADGKLKAGLVFDRSKLNTERILVTWLSPNNWTGAGGFRYGNVRFAFDWEQLVQRKRYYWVESIAYGVPACRILITSNDYGDKLEEYDPTLKNGPWWYNRENNQHYWNGNYCLEIMLEQDLDIEESIGTDFVDHHPQYCSVGAAQCTSRGLRHDRASVLFVAALVGQGIDPSNLKLTQSTSLGYYQNHLHRAWVQLRNDLQRLEVAYGGPITFRHPAALPLARAICNTYSQSRQHDLSRLISLFQSEDSMTESCAAAIADHFQVTDLNTFTPCDF